MILYCNNFNATVLHPRCLCNGRLLTVFSIDGDDTKTIFPTTNSRRPLNPRRICRSLPQTQRYIYGLSLPASPAAVTSPPPPAASLRPPRAEMQLRHCSFVHWREQRASQNGKKTAGRPAKLRRVSRRSCCLFLLRETQRVLRFF